MNWILIVVLGGLAILITLLMRPDIFLAVLRGGGEKREPRIYRPKTDADFQAGLSENSPHNEKRDEHHG